MYGLTSSVDGQLLASSADWLQFLRYFSSSSDFSWPLTEALAGSQMRYISDRQKDLHLNSDGLYCDRDGSIWMPDAN